MAPSLSWDPVGCVTGPDLEAAQVFVIAFPVEHGKGVVALARDQQIAGAVRTVVDGQSFDVSFQDLSGRLDGVDQQASLSASGSASTFQRPTFSCPM